jgi:PH and SEC7 domain-containing protein
VTGGRAMNLLEFINNLAEMNDGEDFPEDILTNIYESIQAAQLEFDRCVPFFVFKRNL